MKLLQNKLSSSKGYSVCFRLATCCFKCSAMEFAVLMIAISTQLRHSSHLSSSRACLVMNFGLSFGTLSSCIFVESVTFINVLKFRAFRFYGILSSAQGYTFFRFIGDLVAEVVDEELSTVTAGDLDLRFGLDGLCNMW